MGKLKPRKQWGGARPRKAVAPKPKPEATESPAPVYAVAADETPIRMSRFQEAVLGIPDEFDAFLGGGRGGGKSWALAFLALRHAEKHGANAKMLYIRQSHTGTRDFEAVCLELFGTLFVKALRFNATDGLFRLPNGATLECNQLDSEAAYPKFQGRSFTLLLIDEAGEYPTLVLPDRLRANLRARAGIPLRTVMAANPGGPGHAGLSSRFVFKAAPWHPFLDEQTGRTVVYAPSTYEMNDFLDREAYAAQLDASCGSDPELLKAWKHGDWAIARGAYFAGSLDERRNAVDPWTEIPTLRGRPFEHWLAHDFGSSAPSVTYLIVKSPGVTVNGRYFSRGSLIAVDELATNAPNDLTRGMGYTVPRLADEIKAMCAHWGVRADGCADDACFAETGSAGGSIANEFRQQEVYFDEARKGDRIGGWTRMRRMLADAGKPDVPGLYVSRACTYFWQTVPYLGRDPRRVEDVDSRGPDHGADALRYGIGYIEPRVIQEPMYGKKTKAQYLNG